MPADQWQAFADAHPGDYGLGVFPDSRDPLRFVTEVGAGAPSGEGGERSPLDGRSGLLALDLARSHVGVSVEQTGPPAFVAALQRAFPPPQGSFSSNSQRVLVVMAARTTQLEDSIARGRFDPVIVLGIGERTPVWIEICHATCGPTPRGVIQGGIARRPAIVTPYDLARTIYDSLVSPAKPVLTAGNRLHSHSDPQALDRARSVAASLTRDAEVGHSVGGTTVGMSIGAALIGVMLLWTGRRRLAIRAALASWAANVGYIVALFVPTGRGLVRAAVMIGCMIGAAALPTGGSARRAARWAFAITAVFALAALIAPLRPGGLPGAAIWGNPLVSWRFFGLQNFEAGLIASGVVLWGVLAGASPRALGVVSVIAGVAIAAPTIGANYVGLLTFAFGVTLAILALARKRVEAFHVVVAGVVAVAGFVLSLLADAGSPVSHGGRAARRISQGGVHVVWDFVSARMRLNVDLIKTFPLATGWILLVVMLVIIGWLLPWGARREPPWPGRAAVWAGAAMALSSMVLEDSGFYSGAIIFVIVICAYIVASGERNGAPVPGLSPPSV